MASIKVYYEAIHPYVCDVTETFVGCEFEECIDMKCEFEYELFCHLPGDSRLFYRQHILEEYH